MVGAWDGAGGQVEAYGTCTHAWHTATHAHTLHGEKRVSHRVVWRPFGCSSCMSIGSNYNDHAAATKCCIQGTVDERPARAYNPSEGKATPLQVANAPNVTHETHWGVNVLGCSICRESGKPQSRRQISCMIMQSPGTRDPSICTQAERHQWEVRGKRCRGPPHCSLHDEKLLLW